MKRALLSVSDKTGILEFAKGLEKLGYHILSTGGTFKILLEGGLKNLQEVSDFTGFPEGLEGRIKTLTPQVFGGILNLRDNPDHQQFCENNKIKNIDIVCVNLYPFKSVYENDTKSFEDKVENIDIGGPSMIRAAAKNYEYSLPVVDSGDYKILLQKLESNTLTLEFKKKLATKVFEMTAFYDLLIAKFWAENTKLDEKTGGLRYGENPHQSAVKLTDPFKNGPDLLGAEILNGKPLSYNNLSDSAGALELALSFDPQTTAFAAIIKHATPCGAAVGNNIETAFSKAYEADPISAFGGVIALNQKCNTKTAEQITSFFNEIVMAPDYDPAALEILKKKKNLRVLKIPNFHEGQSNDLVLKKIRGGLLCQNLDKALPDFKNLKIVTQKVPEKKSLPDLEIAWKLVKMVKSNAIVIVKNGVMIGKGGGQTSRVEAMEIALKQAGKKAQGAVLASDAFFPFQDSIEFAHRFGIDLIIQPGGSIKDPAVIASCDKHEISMGFTGLRSFLH